MGNQLIKNYDVESEPSTLGGIGSPWKIFGASMKGNASNRVSIFMLDKKPLEKKREKDSIISTLKSEVSALAKLRHPGILQIVESVLEDNKTLAFVTEPVKYCLGDLLRQPQLLGAALCDLEVRLGLLDIIQAISFLHTEVRMVHFAICPDNIYIGANGKWKLSGLNYAGYLASDQKAPVDPSLDFVLAAKNFRFDSSSIPLAPLLHFTPNEVIKDKNGTVAVDIFSLGCTIYSVYKALKSPSGEILLMEIDDFSVAGHRAACMSIGRMANMSCLPEDLPDVIMKMTVFSEPQRASLHEISVCRAFQSHFVRAIYYLEHLHEKQDSQKLQFFQGLSNIIERFDMLIMQKRILPALVQNLQHPSLSVHILPNLIVVIKTLGIDRSSFQKNIWPTMLKLVSGKEIPAQSFFIILTNIDLFLSLLDEDAYKKHLMPLVFKGYECGVAQIQMSIIEKTPDMVKEIYDSIYLKTQVLPKFLNGMINAKSPDVRESGLKVLAQIYTNFDKSTTLDVILPSLDRCKKMDVTGSMVMHLMDLYEGVSRTLGHRVTAMNILPAIAPLLVDAEVTREQFLRLVNSATNMIEVIRESRLNEIVDIKQNEIEIPAEEADLRLQIDDNAADIFANMLENDGPVLKLAAPPTEPQKTDIFEEMKKQPEMAASKPSAKPMVLQGGQTADPFQFNQSLKNNQAKPSAVSLAKPTSASNPKPGMQSGGFNSDNIGSSNFSANFAQNPGNLGPNTGGMGTGNFAPNTGNLGSNIGNMARAGNMGPGIGSIGSNIGNSGPGIGNMGPNTGNKGPNTGNMGPNTGNMGPNTGNMGPGIGNFGSNAGNLGPNTGNFGPNKGNMGPGPGNFGANSGSFGSEIGGFGAFSQNPGGFAQNAGTFPQNPGSFGSTPEQNINFGNPMNPAQPPFDQSMFGQPAQPSMRGNPSQPVDMFGGMQQKPSFSGAKPKGPAKINTDDFFNEFLSDKKDPFAGL